MQGSGISTLIVYSDLLGFGSLVANSNGSMDSAVGKIALLRIEKLREALLDTAALFPTETKFFHLNDMVFGTIDIKIEVDSLPVNAETIHGNSIAKETFLKYLKFLSASANLHQGIIGFENNLNLGPAGRTFVVLGKRWEIKQTNKVPSLIELPELHGNMALAEAYQADSMGAQAGFDGSPWDRFYLNDYAWFTLTVNSAPLAPHMSCLDRAQLETLNNLVRPGETFPNCLQRNSEITTKIFHRKRKFYSLMSHHTCNISKALNLS